MKRILLFLGIVLLALSSCKKDEGSEALEGRWNINKTEDDYSFSLIFKGNKLDVYIIAWGEHVEGTYTYANNEITYNITKVSKAWAEVDETEKNNPELTINGSWTAGNMDQETFKLAPNYSWYLLSKSSSHYPGDMLKKFKFEITSSTTAETDLLGGTAHKVK